MSEGQMTKEEIAHWKQVDEEEQALKEIMTEAPCDKDLNVFSRDDAMQTEWFTSIRERSVKEINEQSFEPMLHLLVRDGNTPKVLSLRVAEYVDRKKPIHTFREFFWRISESYSVCASVVVAPAWTPARENGIDKRSQVIFVAETANRRDFVMLDVAEDAEKKNTVSSTKVMPVFDGEAYDRFRNMVYQDYNLARGYVIVRKDAAEGEYASLVVYRSEAEALARKTNEELVRSVQAGELQVIRKKLHEKHESERAKDRAAREPAKLDEEAPRL